MVSSACLGPKCLVEAKPTGELIEESECCIFKSCPYVSNGECLDMPCFLLKHSQIE